MSNGSSTPEVASWNCPAVLDTCALDRLASTVRRRFYSASPSTCQCRRWPSGVKRTCISYIFVLEV